jgi:hypothetical protein
VHKLLIQARILRPGLHYLSIPKITAIAMNIPFQIIDWQQVPATEQPGETGWVRSRAIQLDLLRVRVLEYSVNYLADHWCQKGHVMYVLEGEVETQMEDGRVFINSQGMSYVVSDEMSSHRSFSRQGARILLVDGAFLAQSGAGPEAR